MCLSSIKRTFDVPSDQPIYAYKVFREGLGSIRPVYRGDVKTPYMADASYRALRRIITTDDSDEVYFSGFHCFREEKDAFDLREGLMVIMPPKLYEDYWYSVRRVAIWGEVVEGPQYVWRSGRYAHAYSASDMKILERVEENGNRR